MNLVGTQLQSAVYLELIDFLFFLLVGEGSMV